MLRVLRSVGLVLALLCINVVILPTTLGNGSRLAAHKQSQRAEILEFSIFREVLFEVCSCSLGHKPQAMFQNVNV